MPDRKGHRVRRRFVALLALLVLLGIALFLVAIATISIASPGAPPLTQITSAPPDPSRSRAASFTYTNLLEVDGFECSLDGAPFSPCGEERPSSITYADLAEGHHLFRVRAVSGEATGAAREHRWTVDLAAPGPDDEGSASGGSGRPARPGNDDGEVPSTSTPPGEEDTGKPSPPSGSDGGDDGSGGGTGGGGDPGGDGGRPPAARDFSISGRAAPGDLLYPGGAPVAIPLTIRNPNAVAIRVVELAVALDATRLPPGCRASWFSIAQSNASSARRLTVPARAAVTLPSQGVSAPTIRMLDQGNQDACKRATVHLLYSGRAEP